ncbi:MAG: oligosaccharide flippase family protein [Steroidobacteraceae bacterium]
MRWRVVQLAGVQAIYFLRLLILAKLLAPDAFGLLAIATIAISVMMRLSDVGMIPALVHRSHVTLEEQDAAWTVGLARAAFVALVLVVAAPFVGRLFDEMAAVPVIQVLALRPLIDASASIGVARLTRELKFRQLALTYLPGALADLAIAVATAPTLGVWALVAGAIAGSVVTVIASYWFAPHRPRINLAWRAVAPLIDFGRWVLLAGIATLAGTLVTQLAVSRALGAAALGLYFLALKVAFLPIEAAGAIVGAVAFPMFARLRDDPLATARSFATLLAGLGLVLLPAYALLMVVAPLFEQALGPRWAGTAPIVQILALAGVAAILADLLAPLLLGQGRAARVFGLESLQTGVLLALLWPSLGWFGVEGAALACLAGNVAALLLAAIWTRRLVPGAMRTVTNRFAAASLAAAAAAAVAVPLTGFWSGLPALLAAGVGGAMAAIAVLWMLNAPFRLGLEEYRTLLRKEVP